MIPFEFIIIATFMYYYHIVPLHYGWNMPLLNQQQRISMFKHFIAMHGIHNATIALSSVIITSKCDMKAKQELWKDFRAAYTV